MQKMKSKRNEHAS